MSFIKKIPWFVWVGLIIAILFLWQNLSGYAYSNKLWNMVKDQIVADEKRIIEDLEKDNLANQKEKEGLYQALRESENKRHLVEQENARLKARDQELTDAIQNITVPTDPDALVDLLHKLGLKSVQRRKQ